MNLNVSFATSPSRSRRRGRRTIARTMAAVGAATIVLAAGCSPLGDRGEKLYRKALEQAGRRDWAGAVRSLDSVLEVTPEYAPALLLRGEGLYHVGRYRRALSDAELAADSEDLSVDERFRASFLAARAWIELGRAEESDREFRARFRSTGHPPGAVRCFHAASKILYESLEKRPDDLDVRLWRAYALYRQENFAASLQLLQACRARDPNNWRALFWEALAQEGARGLGAESIETCLELTSRKPRLEHLPLYRYLADVHDELPGAVAREIPKRVAAFRESTGTDDPEIHAFLENHSRRQAREEEDKKLREALSRARALSARGEHANAVEALEKYLKAEGPHPEAERLAVEVREAWSVDLETRSEALGVSMNESDIQKALEGYREALSLTVSTPRKQALAEKIASAGEILRQLSTGRSLEAAEQFLRGGKDEDALKALREVEEPSPSVQHYVLYHYVRGAALLHLGRWEESERSLRRVRSGFRPDRDGLFARALVETGIEAIREGKHSRAVGILAEAVELGSHLDPDRLATAREHLGRSYMRAGNVAGARSQLELVVASDTSRPLRHPEALLDLARIEVQEGRGDEAHRLLGRYVASGGALPADLERAHRRLTAAHEEFVPLDRVLGWTYAAPDSDYRFTLEIKTKTDEGFIVERHEPDGVYEESWSSTGSVLHKKLGQVEFVLPVKLVTEAAEVRGAPAPGRVVGRLAAYGESVELSNGRRYGDCLKVELLRATDQTSEAATDTRYVIFLAPGIGEVRTDVYRDGDLIARTELEKVEFRPGKGL